MEESSGLVEMFLEISKALSQVEVKVFKVLPQDMVQQRFVEPSFSEKFKALSQDRVHHASWSR